MLARRASRLSTPPTPDMPALAAFLRMAESASRAASRPVSDVDSDPIAAKRLSVCSTCAIRESRTTAMASLDARVASSARASAPSRTSTSRMTSSTRSSSPLTAVAVLPGAPSRCSNCCCRLCWAAPSLATSPPRCFQRMSPALLTVSSAVASWRRLSSPWRENSSRAEVTASRDSTRDSAAEMCSALTAAALRISSSTFWIPMLPYFQCICTLESSTLIVPSACPMLRSRLAMTPDNDLSSACRSSRVAASFAAAVTDSSAKDLERPWWEAMTSSVLSDVDAQCIRTLDPTTSTLPARAATESSMASMTSRASRTEASTASMSFLAALFSCAMAEISLLADPTDFKTSSKPLAFARQCILTLDSTTSSRVVSAALAWAASSAALVTSATRPSTSPCIFSRSRLPSTSRASLRAASPLDTSARRSTSLDQWRRLMFTFDSSADPNAATVPTVSLRWSTSPPSAAAAASASPWRRSAS
mmetsp:Transcript_28732/g.91702  ORF Transcript_28732/g.91702 Transcript_28732/m.91702 type:complete len:477 (-) Transcript_28732:780-2210(-)